MDDRGEIEFAPLQGELATKHEFERFAEKDEGSMVIMRESDGEIFIKSEAVIEVGKALGGFWRVLALGLSLLPKKIANSVYDLVARNRYRLAGKQDACELPDDGLRKRMRS